MGAGNVGLDVARMLSKTADELLVTEIPDNVYEGLKASPVEEVHVFARRGPAQAKFTPLELRELDHSPNVEVIVNPEDIEYDDGSVAAINKDNQTKLVVRELERYAMRTADQGLGTRPAQAVPALLRVARRDRRRRQGRGVPHRADRADRGRQRARHRRAPRLAGAGGLPLRRLPQHRAGGPALGQHATTSCPHDAGRVLDLDGAHVPGLYVNGWVKRGPVGLIGHTKGDAIETVGSLLADLETGALPRAAEPSPDAVLEMLESRGLHYTTWEGWDLLDAHEISLGEPHGRPRVKVVDRETMVEVSRAVAKAKAEGDEQAEVEALEHLDEAAVEQSAEAAAAQAELNEHGSPALLSPGPARAAPAGAARAPVAQ